MALVTATTFVISLISFSCNAEAQISSDNNNSNNPNPTLLTELFTNDKQSADTVNIATTTDPSNTMIKAVPSSITTRSYMHQYIDNTGALDARPKIVEAAEIGSQEARASLVTDTTTAEGPAAKAGIVGGDLLADIRGIYTEVSRIINIPKDMPNSSSIVPNSSNQPSANIPNSSNQPSTNIPNSSKQTNAILTYQNNSYGIRIQYPANWTKDERDYNPNDTLTYIATFHSPVEKTSDNYSDNLSIYMKRLTDQNMTLDELANSSITYYNKTLTDFNLIESNPNITLGGGNNPAYGLIYTDRKDGTDYKRMEIETIIGDKIYFITYSAEEKQYSNYLPTIQMMINSLQIT